MEPAALGAGPCPADGRTAAVQALAWKPGLRVDLKRQVVDPLVQVGVLALKLVLRLVDPPTKLAYLVLQRIDTGQKLATNSLPPACGGGELGACREPPPPPRAVWSSSVLSSCRSW